MKEKRATEGNTTTTTLVTIIFNILVVVSIRATIGTKLFSAEKIYFFSSAESRLGVWYFKAAWYCE